MTSHPILDIAIAPDGSVWYMTDDVSRIWRLNPTTADVTRYKIPHQGTSTAALSIDPSGDVWYVISSTATLGQLNPHTRKVHEYGISLGTDRITADRRGVPWFTSPQGNDVGIIDQEGHLRLIPLPTPNAVPSAIAFSSRGDAVVAETGTAKIAIIDPVTLIVKEQPLPDLRASGRQVAVAPDDTVYFTDTSGGYLAHVNFKTGDYYEIASASGRASGPGPIVVARDGMVWYCEQGNEIAKSALVLFNPSLQGARARTIAKMQSWPIPQGRLVRKIVAKDANELWLTAESTAKLFQVKIVRQTERER